MNGNLVTIPTERDHPLWVKGSIPMIGLDEAVKPASFRDFEVSKANYCPLGTPALKPRVSPKVMLVA